MSKKLNKNMTSALLVTAVAGFVMSGPGVTEVQASEGKVKCSGIHSCAGNSDCKGNGNSKCKGHNACGPYGWKYTESEEECKEKGGEVYTP